MRCLIVIIVILQVAGAVARDETHLQAAELSRFLPGTRIRVEVATDPGVWRTGRVLRSGWEVFTMETDRGTLTVRMDELQRLQVSRGTTDNAETGAIIGLAVGTAVGVGVVSGMDSEGGWFEMGAADYLMGAALCGAGGLVVGYAAGATSTSEHWEDIISSPTPMPEEWEEPGIMVGWNVSF